MVTIIEVKIMTRLLNDLFEHWGSNGIHCNRKQKDIQNILVCADIKIPKDFELFYKLTDGTLDQDSEGFQFYNIKDLIKIGKKFNSKNDLSDIILFADYMLESWWYGLKQKNEYEYEIGIVATKDTFTPIAKSLDDFITMYIQDADKLYQYSSEH